MLGSLTSEAVEVPLLLAAAAAVESVVMAAGAPRRVVGCDGVVDIDVVVDVVVVGDVGRPWLTRMPGRLSGKETFDAEEAAAGSEEGGRGRGIDWK